MIIGMKTDARAETPSDPFRPVASPWHTVVLGAIIVIVVIVLPRGIMPYLTGGLRAWNLNALRAQLRATRI